MNGGSRFDFRPPHPYNARTEHSGGYNSFTEVARFALRDWSRTWRSRCGCARAPWPSVKPSKGCPWSCSRSHHRERSRSPRIQACTHRGGTQARRTQTATSSAGGRGGRGYKYQSIRPHAMSYGCHLQAPTNHCSGTHICLRPLCDQGPD